MVLLATLVRQLTLVAQHSPANDAPLRQNAPHWTQDLGKQAT